MKKSLILMGLITPFLSEASGKPKPNSDADFQGKKVVQLTPMDSVSIEMPDQTQFNFEEAFRALLTEQLTRSDRYIVVQSLTPIAKGMSIESSLPDDYVWNGSQVPAGTVYVSVDALNFSTGLGGEKTFYGFDENFRNSFNDGTRRNEFPLRTSGNDAGQPGWFGRTFDRKGFPPFDSQSGLDLGDGFNIDALYAWLSVKYAFYHSELHLTFQVKNPAGENIVNRNIQVEGNGYFFDVSGAYQNYSGGIAIARRDAMKQALTLAISGTFSAIEKALIDMPLMAKVDAVLPDGTVLLGTGYDAEIAPGVLYQIQNSLVVVQVISSTRDGSLARVIQGDLAQVQAGQLVQQVHSLAEVTLNNDRIAAAAVTPPSVDSVRLPDTNLPQTDLQGYAPIITRAEAAAMSLANTATLPYRIWRYFNYDQAMVNGPIKPYDYRKEDWARQTGLSAAPGMTGSGPTIAVIGSGVDYNHPAIRGVSLGKGWDFVSNDPRPYDDQYQGTQVASVIAAVAPQSKILPLKIFSPYGITSSAAVYSAFVYAVDQGAKIILCSWTTPVRSVAMEQGIAYAQNHNVLVIAAAGDMGLRLSSNRFYPAAFAPDYDNLLVVTGVDSQDRLVQDMMSPANADPLWVQLAAPGKDIRVAEPRLGETRLTSTAAAAAFAAGVAARNSAALSQSGYAEMIRTLLNDADSVPGLGDYVRGGLRVRVVR